MRRLAAVLLLALPAAVAQGVDPPAPVPAHLPAAIGATPAGGTAYGALLPAGDTTPLAAAIAGFDAQAGAPRRFAGRITEVCQAKGCWMLLEDDGRTARVMFGDHAFAIPKATTGSAVVHGVLSRKALSADARVHLAGDSARGLAPAAEEYRILADGIEVTPLAVAPAAGTR